jgi:RNA polymerase sigma factor (sigma-70 family)
MNPPITSATWIATALEQHEAALLRFATRLVRDPDRARDVVQETFLQLCSQERSAVEGHLVAWLYRVCRNRAFDLRRKESRVESIQPDAPAHVVVDPVDPSMLAQRREHTAQVMGVLETLPESQREVVYLRFADGLSYKQIAEVTGHSVNHVGVMLHTAVKKVRGLMTETLPAIRNAEVSR